MKEISLTRGLSCIVDDEDYEFLMQWKWQAAPNGGGHFYAARRSRLSDGRKSGERQTMILMHRVLAATPKDMVTDHINGKTLDNRRSNLRVATHTQNMQNRAKRKNTSSAHKGITWDGTRRKWAAVLQANNRTFFIGRFAREEDAAEAYAARAAKEFGEFNREATP